MRTALELPDDLQVLAEAQASAAGISLRQFVIEAVKQRLVQEESRAATKPKVRREPPVVGSKDGPPIGPITSEQIDEALFG